jgi:DNA-directed RNA polymerase specialized sigma24 family protein
VQYPAGLTEKQVLDAINHVVSLLAPGFKFGYHDVEDIKQECFILALAALPRYDGRRPLENFLYTHLLNRLINFKRDKYKRNDCPCLICARAVGNRTEHEGGEFCKKYTSWRRLNSSKQNIMNPVDISLLVESSDKNFDEVSNKMELDEIKRIIDENLPVDFRATYLRMQAGESVPKAKRAEIERIVLEILKERGICLVE